MLALAAVAYAAPPRIIIQPDKVWCKEKGYVTSTERNGKTVMREDMDKAFWDSDFVNVQTIINQIMAERGFPLVNADAEAEADEEDEALDEAFEGNESGSTAKMSNYDALIKDAKPDIIIKIGWNENAYGTLKSLDFRMEAIDSYSHKSVATIAGQSGEVRRSVPTSVVMKTAAANNMDGFCQSLLDYFTDLQENGREIRLDIRVLDASPVDLKQEYNGEELDDIIYKWVSDNTVNHQFTERSRSRNMLRFSQVRIPIYDSHNRPFTAAQFTRQLENYLKSKYNIVAEEASTGLGVGRLYIGEK